MLDVLPLALFSCISTYLPRDLKVARRTPRLIESQMALEVVSKMLRVCQFALNLAVAVSWLVHVAGEGTDEDGGEEDTVGPDEGAAREVNHCAPG